MHSLRSTTKKSTKTGDSIRQLSDPEPNGKSVIFTIHQGFNSVTQKYNAEYLPHDIIFYSSVKKKMKFYHTGSQSF